jgi:hypothetical protein
MCYIYIFHTLFFNICSDLSAYEEEVVKKKDTINYYTVLFITYKPNSKLLPHVYTEI